MSQHSRYIMETIALVDSIALILGHSREQVMRECTIKELLLHAGTIDAVKAIKEQKPDGD